MDSLREVINKIERATPKELGVILDSVNWEVHTGCDWNSISVKSIYTSIVSAIDVEIRDFSTYLAFGNETMNYNYPTGEKLTFDVRLTLSNLTIAKDFFTNYPILTNPKDIDVNSINWKDRDIFFPEEVQAILNIGATTYKRWVDDGWLSETQMEGSSKKYVQKKDIIEFINNSKIRKESWR